MTFCQACGWKSWEIFVCVAYYVVVFEHLHIKLKGTLVKIKTFEVTSETLVQNVSCKILYALHYFLLGTSNLLQK